MLSAYNSKEIHCSHLKSVKDILRKSYVNGVSYCTSFWTQVFQMCILGLLYARLN